MIAQLSIVDIFDIFFYKDQSCSWLIYEYIDTFESTVMVYDG